MARKTKALSDATTSKSNKTPLKLEVPSSSHAKKPRTMDDILRIQAIDFESSDEDPSGPPVASGEILSLRSSLRELQQQFRG